MSIKDKLDYIKETKELIKEGLNNLGEPVGEYDAFRSYPEIIDDLYNNWPRVTATGESVSLDPTMEAPLKIDLKGNTSQTGTPTPSSPIPVNVVSGDNEVVVCGKNLLNLNNVSGTSNSVAYSVNSNGELKLNGTLSSDRIEIPLGISIPLNGTYTYSKNASTGTITLKNSRYTNLFSIGGSAGNQTATVNDNITQIVIYATNGSVYNNSTIQLQIEKGNTPTTYQAYEGNTYSINLGTTELCKIGTYQDYIFKNGDKWYLHKEVGKVVLNGSENWYKSGNTSVDRFIIDSFFPTTNKDILSNHYQAIQSLDTSYPKIYNNSTQLVINHGAYGNLTLEQYKTWLNNNNTNVYYILATATDTEITNTTLINQLEALKGATSYDVQTNISQVNNDKPFILDVEALKGSGS